MTIGVIRSMCVIIYFNPIFCPKLSWLISLFFDISLLYYYIYFRLLIIFCLSSGDIFFMRYFFVILICNCFQIILLWIFWNFSILPSYALATASAMLLPIKFIYIFVFDIPLSSYYIKYILYYIILHYIMLYYIILYLRSSIISQLSSGGSFLFLGISL